MIDCVYLIYGETIYVSKYVVNLTQSEPDPDDELEHKRFETAIDRLEKFVRDTNGSAGDVYLRREDDPTRFEVYVDASDFRPEADGHLFLRPVEGGDWYVCKKPDDLPDDQIWMRVAHTNLRGNTTVSCAYSTLGADFDLADRFRADDPEVMARGSFALINELGEKPSIAVLAFESLTNDDDSHGSLADFGG